MEVPRQMPNINPDPFAPPNMPQLMMGAPRKLDNVMNGAFSFI
jgi:hypothetical protein